ncbi:FAD-dependent oxidoreductase [Sulfuracidifex tepidarius]|uniref:Dihydrolipoyl dehydrogenase n=1 Tax=Sulfuracidifex tepidarius TaxID=1294262 RepID=A0A510E6X0_9CREN|nr:NAD(P)/FAD-dependent oxidoreductase [Sulfuracidifex tepidarius]BBG28272.1 Dihydrolipoyl dehydrogenase [Sulfuracidifex tepidarius]
MITVIGGGPAGIYASIEAAKRGAKVTLIEREDRLGGTCTLYGCIPTKSMLYPLNIRNSIDKIGGSASISTDTLQQLAKGSIERLSKGIESILESMDINVVHGKGFLRSGKVNINNESVDSDAVIITTGTERKREEGLIYSEDLHEVDLSFRSIGIIGGDVGGLESAWMLKELGKEVYLIDRSPFLLSYLDNDMRSSITNFFKKIGIKVILNTEVKEIAKKGESFSLSLSDGITISVERVLKSFGRYPATEGIDLPKERYIKVDDYLRTGVNNIYAAGDVIGTHTAHSAIHAGKIAGSNATGSKLLFNREAIPHVVYTKPEIAYTGIMEGNCVKLQAASNGREIIERETQGFLKLCSSNDRLISAEAFMEGAEYVISIASLMIRMHLTLPQLMDFIPPHPSTFELLKDGIELLANKK